MNVIERARDLLKPRPEGTPGQLDQERETAVSLGLMADAKAAGAEMTDEQAIFLSSSMEGMRNRISVLLGVPDRSLAQDRELVMIQRELARLEGRTDAPVLVPREEPQTGPKRFLSAVAGVQLWHVLAVGWAVTFGLLGLQSARVASLKGDVREMAEVAADNQAAAARWQERADEYREGLVDAANVARQAADALEAERLANIRRAERERRRNREVANVLARSPDAPEWRLRDTDGQTEGDGNTP